MNASRINVRAAVMRDSAERIIVTTGQEARALLALIAAGTRGVTAQEVSSWAYRFAAYCHSLRRKGLAIVTIREEHPGGWHGRHLLLDRVRLLDGAESEAA
jgi:hypothetical protein